MPSIEYVEVASGVTVHVATVSPLVVFAVMVRIWPAPVPPVMRTWELIHWLAVHGVPATESVVAVALAAVPVANAR